MNRHRSIAGMMRAASGGLPPTDDEYIHLWRAIDIQGSVIPDIRGNANGTIIGNGTMVTVDGDDAWRSTETDGVFTLPYSSLSIDVHDVNVDYTVIMAIAAETTNAHYLTNESREGLSCHQNGETGLRAWTNTSGNYYRNGYSPGLNLRTLIAYVRSAGVTTFHSRAVGKVSNSAAALVGTPPAGATTLRMGMTNDYTPGAMSTYWLAISDIPKSNEELTQAFEDWLPPY